MAKKKKATRKKKQIEDVSISTAKLFWRQVFAFLLMVLGIFLFLGGFGWGGALPVGIFNVASWLFGYAAYLLPFVCVYLSILKFLNEEHVIPFAKLANCTLLLSTIAALLHVFVDRDDAAAYAGDGVYGGQVGNALSSLLLSIFNSVTAFAVFFFVALTSLLLLFGITPRRMFAYVASMFRREPKDEDEATDLAQLKNKEHEFKLHEGVPTVHHEKSERQPVAARGAGLKNSAPKLTNTEDHAALTAASDPNWKFPGLHLLNQKQDKADPGNVEERAEIIREGLANFNIEVEMEGANVGPRVTQYTLKPNNGVKMSKIVSLSDNIAYDLAATSIRIEAPIPGKRAVGIEVPNITSATVRVASILSSSEWAKKKSSLSFAIGKDIAGNPVVGQLDKMPHLLIAGQTGSGKSVMINTLLTSMLYRNSPSDLKLILVDPKTVELTPYNNIPHLLTPVIVEPEKCISALKWAVAEMERRLRTFGEVSKRNIAEYNELKKEEGMPYIVIVIDELADLMMMAARDVEALIVRLAQKARAAGIHLVLATQRPSVDVITGLIKANVPARIAFTVTSQVDSRTIIDGVGAEKLLGMGDMLFKTQEMPKPIRVQGAFIDDGETMKVTDFLREQRDPQYDDEVVSMPVQLNGKGGIVVEHAGGNDADDDMWQDAVRVVIEGGKASTSLLQRRLRIGYGRASRLIDMMEEQGIIGAADGSRPREVLVRSMDEAFGVPEAPVEDGARHIEVTTDPRDEFLTR